MTIIMVLSDIMPASTISGSYGGVGSMSNAYPFLEKSIFTTEDVRASYSSDEETCEAIKELLEGHRIEELKKGLYATVDLMHDDVFASDNEIGAALQEDAYCAYHTAMEFYGLATQVYFVVQMASPKKSFKCTVNDTEYWMYRNTHTEGVVEIMHNSAVVRVTDLERTIVDCIDKYNVAGGMEEVSRALRRIRFCNEEKLLKYLRMYNKKILYKKAGFLFSRIKPRYLSQKFYDACKEHISTRKDDIRYIKGVPYYPDEWNEEWRIYASPEYFS
ncbi:MAG: hypothetical protein LUE27_09350 [Clostridia bacterium]|nr:hypothetical protein [Clostridia bacterium]